VILGSSRRSSRFRKGWVSMICSKNWGKILKAHDGRARTNVSPKRSLSNLEVLIEPSGETKMPRWKASEAAAWRKTGTSAALKIPQPRSETENGG